MPDSDRFRRLIGGLALAVGVLVLGLSGTCTGALLRNAPNSFALALVFGGPFIALGVFTMIAAVGWIRGGARTVNGSGLGLVYMLFGAIALLAGLFLVGSSWPAAMVAWALSAGLLWLGWRMTMMT